MLPFGIYVNTSGIYTIRVLSVNGFLCVNLLKALRNKPSYEICHFVYLLYLVSVYIGRYIWWWYLLLSGLQGKR